MSRTGQSIETESRSVVSKAWGIRGAGREELGCLLMNTRFLWRMKGF